MSDAVHLLVPFAACSGPACRDALKGLPLPNLQKLLARLQLVGTDEGDPHSLSMPHERVLAREYGLTAPDGLIPWAAWQVQHSGGQAGQDAWARITPCHWRVGTDHAAMSHPKDLQLDASDSQALLNAMQPYFREDGIELQYEAPTQWLARGEIFRQLPTASLDRVIGRAINEWLPRGPQAGALRRLQQEMQMLLYTFALNDERQRGGLLPVNSFWISGTGALPPTAKPDVPRDLQITHYLRDAALLEDWQGWRQAWQQLDARECAHLLAQLNEGRTVTLTLCGERNARTWSGGGAMWNRIVSMVRKSSVASALEAL